MRYTITIKDNKTNAIVVDDQTDCIIGALALEDTTLLALSDGKIRDIINLAVKAVNAADHIINYICDRIKEENNA